MSTYGNNGSTLGKVVTWFFVALLVIGALKLAFWVVGAAVGIGLWAIFTIGPILLVGWIVMKLFNLGRRDTSSGF